MARTSTYLNFPGTTEAAFAFYKSVFGTEYSAPIHRMGEAPPTPVPPGSPDMPPMPDAFKNLILHIELPILGGHVLMGTDAVDGMGHTLVVGNNVHLNLEPDTLDEAERLYAALSEGATIAMPLQRMFWGAYWASLQDRFGVHWMINAKG